MSSAIILSAASVDFFWSTCAAAGAVPELEMGLKLELGEEEGLGVSRVFTRTYICSWSSASRWTLAGSSFSFLHRAMAKTKF